MKMKEKILEILYDNEGRPVSGEELAGILNVTRNSIWKAVCALRSEGYKIEAKQRLGYILTDASNVFSEKTIKKHLNGDNRILIFDKETSSNDVAKRLANENEKEGTVVIVNSQTNGRGRMGRSFISKSENGLYMSIILRPKLPASVCTGITVLAATAVCEAIEKTTKESPSIKWVNDIYINGRKVCGILTEASFDFESGLLNYAICGIGINIVEPEGGFDDEIKDIAGAIFKENSPKDYKSILCAKIIDEFFRYYNDLEHKTFIEKYREKSNIIGEEVTVYCGSETAEGKAIDIDENASLVVRLKSGEIRSFSSGEARVRKNGNKLS